MKVYDIGSKVSLNGIEAQILTIRIQGDVLPLVDYEVVWWSGNDRKTSWVCEFELVTLSDTRPFLDIGFHNGQEAD